MTHQQKSQQRCLITGGSRGLGRSIGLAFARRGARVAFTYCHDDDDAAEAESALTRAGASPLVFKGSVADAAHVKNVVDSLAKQWGGIDVLVNNAGVTQVLPVSLLEESDWDLVLNVNLKGAYLFSRAVLRQMIRAKSGQIINIGNFASERIIEAPIHYAASKSGLRGLTDALAREVGRYGIRVNLVAPGLLEEGLSQALPQHRLNEYLRQCAMGRLGRLDELAEVVAFLSSERASFMTGAKLSIDGGL